MSRARAVGGSGAVYASGVGFLFLAELLLAREQDPAAFGEYQLLRQAVPLVCVLAIFGRDQALIRFAIERGSLGQFRAVLSTSVLAALAIGAFIGIVSDSRFDLALLTVLALVVAPAFVVVSELAAAALRVRSQYVPAAAIQQGYRLLTALLLFVVIPLGLQSRTVVAASVLLATGAVAWAGFSHLRGLPREKEDPGVRRVGAAFGLSLLPLTALDWFDQAAVSHFFDDLSAGGDYAAVKILTVYPAITLASILGFVALPELVRSRSLLTIRGYVRAVGATLLVSLGLGAVLYIATLAFAPALIDRSPSGLAILLLASCAGMRVLYVVPSAVLGALGSAKLIASYSALAVLILPAGILTISFLADSSEPVLAGAAGLAVGTFLRTCVAVIAGWHALRLAPKVDNHVPLSQ